MDDWEFVEIGKYLEVQNGYAFKSKDFADSGGIPVIKIKNVASGSLNMDDAKHYRLPIDNLDRYIIKTNDILIAMTGSHVNQPSSMVGKIARYSQDTIALLNQRVGKIYSLDENKLSEYFIFYFFRQKNVTYELALNAGGSANQANISPKLIKSLEFFRPPIQEQKAITAVLSSLDNKIDLLHRQNKTLEALAQTLFRHWFIDNADDDWEEKPLSEVVDIAIGRTPPRKEFHWFSTSPINTKWVSIKDLGNEGIFIFDTSEYLTAEAIERFRVPVIPKDTVVLSFKMTLGRVGITTEAMTSNEAIAHFKFKDDTPFCNEYLYFFLKLFKYQELGSTSSIVTSINTRMIKAMEISIPDAETMSKFADITQSLFEKIKKNQAQIRTLEKLRDTLLPKLMSGTVRVRL